METSKNEVAKVVVGLRGRGQSFDLPWELGYACPVCGGADEATLDFSEYNGFIYCEHCNLDIPSCLCVKYEKFNEHKLSKRDKIIRATEIFLATIKQAKMMK